MKRGPKLSLLERIESSGAAFWNRNSDNTISIHVRGEHGNDPNQWHNANTIADMFGSQTRKVEPDPMSGHIVVTIKGWD